MTKPCLLVTLLFCVLGNCNSETKNNGRISALDLSAPTALTTASIFPTRLGPWKTSSTKILPGNLGSFALFQDKNGTEVARLDIVPAGKFECSRSEKARIIHLKTGQRACIGGPYNDGDSLAYFIEWEMGNDKWTLGPYQRVKTFIHRQDQLVALAEEIAMGYAQATVR